MYNTHDGTSDRDATGRASRGTEPGVDVHNIATTARAPDVSSISDGRSGRAYRQKTRAMSTDFTLRGKSRL